MTSIRTTPLPLKLKPGINKNTTIFDSQGEYVDCDKIRFRFGEPEKLGGWQKEQTQRDFVGVPRAGLTWSGLNGTRYIAAGTNEKLELFYGGNNVDITPLRQTVSVSNSFSIASGSSLMTVSFVAHGGQPGDWVIFANTTASVAGVTLSSEYKITEAIPNSFVVDLGTAASTSVVSAGGSGTLEFLIPSGGKDNGGNTGYGGGTYGTPGITSGGWSDPRNGALRANLRQYSLSNWGEDLIATPKGSSIFYWDATNPNDRAEVISTAAPSVVNFSLVAQPERQVIALGTHTINGVFDPMLVRWCASEDFDDWIASPTNNAGGFRLDGGSEIQGGVLSKREILVFTDEAVYSMISNATGYSFDKLGTNPGLCSSKSGIDVNGTVYWMGPNGFYLYDGTIRQMACTLQKAIFGEGIEASALERLNQEQKEKVFCGLNAEFSEIIWFYPAGDSLENNRYVIFNYLENTWYDGTLDRTVWVDADVFDKPYALKSAGGLFIHEQGVDDDTVPMKSFLKTSVFDLDEGDAVMFVDRVIPDGKFVKPINMSFEYSKYPGSTEVFTKGPFQITSTTRKFNPRIRGRQMSITYSTSVGGGDFRIGRFRANVKPDGER